tara:strand:+ start:296 stop:418 length:123 start_codon:yes stop_codon:yes gene_type:complete
MKEFTYNYFNVEFFPQFSDETFFEGFYWLPLATRKFPKTR